MAYAMYRVFCATPGDLEPERRAFHDVIGEINEAEAMPRNILLVPVSLLPHVTNKLSFQRSIDDNVRACTFFVQVLHNTWGPPARNFESEFKLARQLKNDGASLMAGVALFLKASDGLKLEPAVLELKSAAQSQPDGPAHEFVTIDEYKALLRNQLSAWLSALQPSS
jgi:hypothetical protein